MTAYFLLVQALNYFLFNCQTNLCSPIASFFAQILSHITFLLQPISTMPSRCSAPNCRSGYDGEDPIPVFKMREEFSDEEKDQWRKFLHRADSSSLKHIYFCAKHFQPWEVVLPEDWIYIVSFEFV